MLWTSVFETSTVNRQQRFASSDYTVDEQPSETVLIQELESGRAKPLVFVLNANLLALVKLVNCTCLLVRWIKTSH